MYRSTAVEDIEGEVEKFQYIYTEYRTKVYQFAMWVLRDTYLAEDAVQEVFLKFFRQEGLNKIQDMNGQSVKNYITILTKNVVYNMFNKRKRSKLTFMQDELDLFAGILAMEDVTDLVLKKLDKKEMADTIHKLPKNYEVILELKYYHQLSDKEMAIQLQIKEATARKRLERARKLLRVQYLEDASVYEML